MVKHTYSRKRPLMTFEEVCQKLERTDKRRRVERAAEAPSSPSQIPTLTSDPTIPSSTPPSSPPSRREKSGRLQGPRFEDIHPPWPGAPAQPLSKEELGLKFDEDELDEMEEVLLLHCAQQRRKKALETTNANSKQPPRAISKAQAKPKPKKLTQMTLDLGQKTQKKCKDCGMEYCPSVKEDMKLHDKFHSQNVDGIPIAHKLAMELRALDPKGDFASETVVIGEPLSLSDRPWKTRDKLIKTVLEIVETELGGVGIPEEQLFSNVEEPIAGDAEGQTRVQNRYKIFLCLRKDKVIGVCLAEQISNAHPLLPPVRTEEVEGNKKNDGAITTGEEARLAKMGISRIWVSKCARGSGIAGMMLDEASERFLYSLKIPKQFIAFSQPTESGAKLARKWFGKDHGWLVYGG